MHVRSTTPVARILLSTTAFLLGVTPLAAQESIETPDVDLLARTILSEIEVIRWHMGRPLIQQAPLPVEGVAIRENFRQAMTLWRKVNQLGVEVVGGGEPPPVVDPTLAGDYGPPEVYEVLAGVLDRLQEIREGSAIVAGGGMAAGEASPVEIDPSADPTDVFEAVVQANRQVNLMLQRQAQPGDVYQQVQQATFYAAQILAAVDDSDPFPLAPDYLPGLTPSDVYGRLLEVFNRLSVAFNHAGLDMVSWGGDASDLNASLQPSDVLDLATLLLSELEYLHSQVPGARAPLQAEHPGQRWPSDVFQEAGRLSAQAARVMLHAERGNLVPAGGGVYR